MKLSISDLKTDRQWRALIGLNEKIFLDLLLIFERKHQDIFQESIEDKRA